MNREARQVRSKILSRRELLRRALAIGGCAVVGPGFIAAPNAAWALEVQHIKSGTMATLLQMARDIYPHDRVGDEFYVRAIKTYDSVDMAAIIEAGIADLNERSGGQYVELGWERQRVEILKTIEETEFFQIVRGGLITGLYNQKAVWPIFGYEGESFSKGGYINHGFDDIDWL